MEISNKNIEIISDSFASLVPAFAGLSGNPFLAVGGAFITPIIRNQICESLQWVLSNKQKRKVYATANMVCSEVDAKISKGQSVRTDDFFNTKYNNLINVEESPASKLLEGTLLKAKEEYDSKKLPYFSFLTSNIFFAPNISESKAFVLLEILDRLSYRQLCALSIFYKKNTLPVGRWETRLKASPHLQNYYDIAYEFISLKDSLLIEQYFPNGGMGIGISDYRITSIGKELFLTANLSNLNNQDVSGLESQMDYLTANLQ